MLHLLFEQASITGEAVRMARHLGADEVLRLLEEEASAAFCTDPSGSVEGGQVCVRVKCVCECVCVVRSSHYAHCAHSDSYTIFHTALQGRDVGKVLERLSSQSQSSTGTGSLFRVERR